MIERLREVCGEASNCQQPDHYHDWAYTVLTWFRQVSRRSQSRGNKRHQHLTSCVPPFRVVDDKASHRHRSPMQDKRSNNVHLPSCLTAHTFSLRCTDGKSSGSFGVCGKSGHFEAELDEAVAGHMALFLSSLECSECRN